MKFPLLTLTAALTFALPFAHSAEPRKKSPRATPAPDATAPVEQKEPRSLSGRALPYKVKVTAIDEPAATFSSVGKGGVINVFAVTEKTAITKDTKPATFTDLTVGSIVIGSRTRTLGGKWEVATVNIQSIAATPKPRGKKDPAKPAETKPAETKPAETKPAETKPAETKPDEPKPAEKSEAAPAPAPSPVPEPPAAPAPAPTPAEPPKATETARPEEQKPEEKRIILR